MGEQDANENDDQNPDGSASDPGLQESLPDEFPSIASDYADHNVGPSDYTQSDTFPLMPVAYTPDSTEETVRRSGLAWSVGIVFFGSVAFMLFLGWLADLLLGSTPWGIVGGVIVGSVIGFVQFFRLSSQIFRSEPEDHRSFLSRDDDESPPGF